MNNNNSQLSSLIDMQEPYSVLGEVKTVYGMMFPGMEFEVVRLFFDDIVRLFRGEFPGYRKCNTEYHDLKHTTDTFLATARLIHGAIADGHRFSERSARLGLISALMHDTGYSQTIDDEKGTGAKYTIEHVDRSIDFAEVYFKRRLW